MQISGWIETEDGAINFDITATNMLNAAQQLRTIDQDAGHTDMEACDEDGEDVTVQLYTVFDTLDKI